jgi:hypothetical protein
MLPYGLATVPGKKLIDHTGRFNESSSRCIAGTSPISVLYIAKIPTHIYHYMERNS